MKKLAVVVVVLFISATGLSQEFDLGVKVGSNFATISDAENGPSSKTGIQAGVFAGMKLSEKAAIQVDLLYSQQGAEFNVGEFDLTYVNIPVVLKFYVFRKFNIQVGPQFGVLVDDTIKDLPSEIFEAESSDISGIVGFGYDLPLGLRVDGRYNFGFTDVFKDFGGRNSVLTLAVGFSFL